MFRFVGELLFSPADKAVTGLIVFPQRAVRPLEPLHVPKSDREPQKQFMSGGGGRSAEPFVLLNLDVLGNKERRNSEPLIGAQRDGLAPILNLFRPVRSIWRVHFFAGQRQFRDDEFPSHLMQNGRSFSVVRHLEMHKMPDMRMVVAEVYFSDV